MDVPRPLLSANEIIRQVRVAGFKVQRQAALKVIAQVKAQVAARAYIAGLRPNQLPLSGKLSVGPYAQQSRYKYIVMVKGKDASTGLAGTQHVTIWSNSLRSTSDAELQAVLTVGVGNQYQITELSGVTTIDILRGPNFNWPS